MAPDASHNARLCRAARAWLAVVLILIACVLPAQATPRIGIATMQPGEIFFERFGHNSIIVDDPARNEPLSYNFGFFDMGEDGFFGRFVEGEMMYRLAELPWRDDLAYYLETGRGVTIQWLDLDDAQATALAAALAENARPENSRYRYDYFIDNCATRVRDAIDRALGGTLKPQLISRSQGNTYRSEAVRLASPAPWMWLGFDLALGPSSDQPMSRWEEGYVPMRLAASLREVKLPDGRPLIVREETVAPHRIAPEPPEFQRAWWRWLLAGMVVGGLWLLLGSRLPRTAGGFALAFWLLAGLFGALSLFIWLQTAHHFAWVNHNLLLLNPLSLLLLPGAWHLLRGRDAGRFFRIALTTVCVLVAISPFLHWSAPQTQANGHWIALLLPIHAALAWMWLRKPRQSP